YPGRIEFNELPDIGASDGKRLIAISTLSLGKWICGADYSEKSVNYANYLSAKNNIFTPAIFMSHLRKKYKVVSCVKAL
ncbi:MAG: hypothetical protein LBK01_05440, partial [Burkholderiaceae bacterium]|nr:hypothetical protein [Burkholderiaceae bacterium]